MNSINIKLFTDTQKDILQEIMNIAFGNATADLAEVVDIYVVLSVPNIEIIGTGELPGYIIKTIETYAQTTIINQKFSGDFKGSGFFVFPNVARRDLLSILEDSEPEFCNSGPVVSLEKEIIIEIGSILIGACVGKISELLNTSVMYSPPQVVQDKSVESESFVNSFDPSQSVIAMKTVFNFEKKDIKGFILLITDQESIEWLRSALDKFMESYQ